MVKVNSKSQNGRSMVEMLGVLAIVGVLSVGGVYGYGVAMKKHKANEALHKASMLATTVSAYAMSNDGNLPTSGITDFGNSGYNTDLTDNGTKFDLKMEGVGYDVCKQMESSMGGMVRNVTCVEGSDDVVITYYKNLATTEAEGEKSPTGGSGSTKGNPGPSGDEDGAECSGTRPGVCSVCRKTYADATAGHWYDSDALCTEPGQTCVDGGCVESAKDEPTLSIPLCKCIEVGENHFCGGENGNYEFCSSDAVCAKYGTWDSTQEKCVIETFCTNNSDCTSDEYCHYTSVDYLTCKPNQKGICVKKADAKGDFASGTTAEADGFIRSRADMDWFTAQNFCRSYGKNLVTLSQMGLGSAVPSGEPYCSGYSGTSGCQITANEWSAIQAKFGTDFYPWTANLVPSISCDAFAVALFIDDAFVYNAARYYNQGYGSALCK